MKVLKFGGTSVGSVERMKSVAALINNKEPKIVVLSAMSGTTNTLERIAKCLFEKDHYKANNLAKRLESDYYNIVNNLYKQQKYCTKAHELIKSHFDYIRSFTRDVFTVHEEKTILAQGELISTALFSYYLEQEDIQATLLSALNFMRVDKDHEPDMFYIKENIKRELEKHENIKIFITQGYICRNSYGEIDNLMRGGSDFSASIIASAIGAQQIQIWTDVSGIHDNDPRIVDNTHPIKQLSFDEAAELAYFGAKILHPSSILPAQLANIPVWLKNTLKPQDEGTLITSESGVSGIKAVAAKDNITAIKIKSGRMLLAYGFLRKIFEIFETYRTPIDMITTSEIAVSLTIDNNENLSRILAELERYGSVEIDKNQTIVCVVGDFIAEYTGIALKVFEALSDVPIRMISYGGSRHNVSILINTKDKQRALQALSKHIFS